ncbi:hypothetical protein M0R45_001358 [Rubus argutus]|uniref:FBD domain-containing protein n=1 Tax=Rubus argutus TaxID=59490 RepID=A0AAW1VN73_RUBAR
MVQLNSYWEREIQQKADNFSHHCLRVVEPQGYCHTSSDFKLVMYLIENAVELKKLVIPPDPIRDMYYHDRLAKAKSREVNTEERARKLARHQLREKVPLTIELVCHL